MANQSEIFEELGLGNLQNGCSGGMSKVSADQLGNDLLCALDPKLLRLTQKDNLIYEEFKKEFPDFKLKVLEEEELKSPAAKEKWRPFCSKFEKEIEDFSFATLVRLNCEEDYTEENTILVTRIQFFCIEISRNREGLNDSIRNKFKPKPRTKCKA
ncbi:Protein PBDC1 [Armadillidium nasatum]|uniref:Protein PBDC1 n=1 Tax=Armadillidium nasatum TaxID=96803 RepID=A0A5N5STU2_9CRUS|nr:Protein PBDC1 [Armadillidium nasatum]